MKKNGILYIFIIGILLLLCGCFRYSVAASKIKVDEATIPNEVTVKDFVLSDIKLIVERVDGTTDLISVGEEMLSSSDLEKLTRSGNHIIYIRYDGKLASLNINLLENYPTIQIQFETNGGTTIGRQVIEKNSRPLRPSNPKKPGYVFNGWYKDLAFEEPFSFSEELEESIIIYAKWSPITNVILYETNGGTKISSTSAETGDTIEKPEDPTREGYTFDGWYVDKGCNEKYDFNKEVDKSFTLYAKWIAHEYTIRFMTNGGTSIKSIKAKHDQLLEKPEDPIRFGYQIEGWYIDEEFTTKYSFTEKVTGNLTLYVKWETAVYKIEFEENGGTIVSNQEVKHGNKLTGSIETTKEYHKFIGWYTDSEFTTYFNPDAPITKDLVLYAKWEGQKINITFVKNNGSENEVIEVEYGQKLNKPANPIYPGYKLIGWYKDKELTEYFNFDEEITNEFVLYAKWIVDTNTKKQYSVVIFGENDEVLDTIKVYEGETLVNLVAPKRELVVFENWYTDSSCNTVYDLEIAITSNISIYANYVPGYEVKFYDKDGKLISEALVGEGMSAEPYAPTAPYVEGYKFIGWNKDLEVIVAPTAFKAIYAPAKHKVKFVSDDKVLFTQELENGEVPVTPEDINKYAKTGYHFAGWDRELSATYSDAVYTARWEKNIYAVDFVDYIGNVYYTVNVIHGERVSKPTTFSNEYYSLNNWYLDKNYSSLFDFTRAITCDTKVYGHFDFKSTIIYRLENNEIVISNIDASSFVKLEIPSHLNNYEVRYVEGISNCENVVELVIPKTVSNISLTELLKFTSLERVVVDGDSLSYTTIDGVLYNKELTKLLLYPVNRKSQEYTVFDNVNEIGDNAFSNNKNLIKLDLNNITKLGHKCFANSNITNINVSMDSIVKENDTFENVIENFKIIVLRDYYQHYLTIWNELQNMIYSTETIYQGLLYKVVLGEVVIVEYVGNESYLEIPKSINGLPVTSISEYAFNSIFGLKGITLPNSIVNISDNAFTNLKLRYLKINSKLVISGNYLTTLKNMLSNTIVYIEDSLYSQYQNNFEKCYSMNSINGDYSFVLKDGQYGVLQYLGSSKEITIPEYYGTEKIHFISKGFIENIDIEKIYLTSLVDIEDDAIKDTAIFVEKELLDEYKEKYPNNVFYDNKMVIKEDSKFVYGILNDEIIIIKIKGYSKNIEIPEYIDSLPIVRIGMYALSKINELSTITIGSKVEILDKESLKTSSENQINIIFTSKKAPIIDGDICYLSDSIYKENEGLQDYGIRFPEHLVLPYGSIIKENEEYKYAIGNDKVTIIQYLSNGTEITIPEKIDSYEVVEIAPNAFNNKITVRKVILPKTINYIGYKAFDNARNLSEIIINSDKVVYIEGELCYNPVIIRVPNNLLHRYRNSEIWEKVEVISNDSNVITSGDITYVVEDGKAIILSVKYYLDVLTIFDNIDGYEIERFGAYSLYDTSVKNLTIRGVKEISYNALPKGLENVIFYYMDAPLIEEQTRKEFNVRVIDIYQESFINSDCWKEYNIISPSAEGRYNELYEYLVDNGEIIITKYLGNEKEIVIPDTIDNVKVTSIGKNAFVGKNITSVTFGNNITSIGEYAFYGIESLSTITGGNNITSIGAFAFHETEWLDYQYANEIIIGKVFYHYNARYTLETKAVIPDSVVSIAPYAFLDVTQISNVIIPSSVVYIGDGAFKNCKNLTSIVLPTYIEEIKKETFMNCSRLKEVQFGSKVNIIGSRAFQGCSLLNSISSIENITEIGNNAFDGCNSLGSVVLPQGLKVLGKNVFINCQTIEVSIVNTNTTYSIVDGILYNKEKTILIEDLLKSQKRYVKVLNTVDFIEENAFALSDVLKVEFVSAVTLDRYVFKENKCLEAVIFNTNSLPKLSENSIPTTKVIYISNKLLEEAKKDYLYSNYVVKGIVEFSVETYTTKVGSKVTIVANCPLNIKASDIKYETSNSNILAYENGGYIAKGEGTVYFTAIVDGHTDILTITVKK